MVFVVRSCLPKITQCLGADLCSFRRPLEVILDGWLPVPGDVLAPKQVRVKKSYGKSLLLHLAVAKVDGEEDRYEWSIDTASIWISALCHVIKDAKLSASKCRNRIDHTIDSNALLQLCSALAALQFLSYRMPIHELLSLPSIQSRLNHDYRIRTEGLLSDDGKLG